MYWDGIDTKWYEVWMISQMLRYQEISAWSLSKLVFAPNSPPLKWPSEVEATMNTFNLLILSYYDVGLCTFRSATIICPPMHSFSKPVAWWNHPQPHVSLSYLIRLIAKGRYRHIGGMLTASCAIPSIVMFLHLEVSDILLVAQGDAIA
jgi:hypothetical protein